MRVISLDFDGPLHPTSAVADWQRSDTPLAHLRVERDLFRWVPILVELLEAHPDVAIMVHSGWRTLCRDFELREYLGALGERFIGSTPLVGKRYAGIMQCVERFEISDYLIIDDADYEFPPGLPELVLVHPDTGISDQQVIARIRAWLERSPAGGTSAGAEREQGEGD